VATNFNMAFGFYSPFLHDFADKASITFYVFMINGNRTPNALRVLPPQSIFTRVTTHFIDPGKIKG